MYKFLFITNPNLKYSGSNVRIKNLAFHLSNNNNLSYLILDKELIIYRNKKIVVKKKISILYFFYLMLQNYKFWFCDILLISLLPKKGHCFTLHDNKEWTKYARSGEIKKIVLRYIVYKSKYFFTVSDEQKKFLKRIYKNKKIHVSYNGIHDDWINKKKINKSQIKNYLIYVSNITIHKNHLSILKQKSLQRNYKIIFVGRPIDEHGQKIYKKLKKYKYIKIYKNISQQHLIKLVKHSSFVLFPSNFEGFGIPIIEALSQRKNILLNNKIKFKYLSSCKRIFPHDFKKQIKGKKISRLKTEKNCKHCLELNYSWNSVTDNLKNTLKIN